MVFPTEERAGVEAPVLEVSKDTMPNVEGQGHHYEDLYITEDDH